MRSSLALSPCTPAAWQQWQGLLCTVGVGGVRGRGGMRARGGVRGRGGVKGVRWGEKKGMGVPS